MFEYAGNCGYRTSYLYKIIELQERGYDVMEHNIFIKLKNLLFREYADICLSCGCCGGEK